MLDIYEVDDKNWTGLIWGVVNNHVEIVKCLLQKDLILKEEGYKHVSDVKKEENNKTAFNRPKNDFEDIFKKPLNPSNFGKYNPLHWACYKGNILIMSLLLKHNYNPLDIDIYGNQAIHQGAASNNLELFKKLIGLGLDLEVKNARNHSCMDLTTNKEITNLIIKNLNCKACQICQKNFDFFTKKHLCYLKEEIICKNCCEFDYYYLNADSETKEIIDLRCKNCQFTINEAEQNLKNKLNTDILKEVEEALNYVLINNIKICEKLKRQSEIQIDKLKREKDIKEHINNLEHVENHKTIEKSVFLLEQMLKEAESKNLSLSSDIIDNALAQKARLLAEKELRKVLSNLSLTLASDENLKTLNEKIVEATLNKVEAKYIDQGADLSLKIQRNLETKALLDLFLNYPIREYPIIEVIDPKKKSIIILLYFKNCQ